MGVARGSRMPVMENLLTAGKSMSGGWPSSPLLCLVPTDDLQGCVYYYPHVSHEKLQLQKVKHLQPTRKDGARTLIPVPITPACRLFFFTWCGSAPLSRALTSSDAMTSSSRPDLEFEGFLKVDLPKAKGKSIFKRAQPHQLTMQTRGPWDYFTGTTVTDIWTQALESFGPTQSSLMGTFREAQLDGENQIHLQWLWAMRTWGRGCMASTVLSSKKHCLGMWVKA